MKVAEKTIEIKSIQFESNDPDVLVKGIVSQGNLNYPTDILVSQTQLNKIVNSLKKQNSSFDLNKYLLIETMYNNETLFTANLDENVNSKLALHQLLNTQTFVQIRA